MALVCKNKKINRAGAGLDIGTTAVQAEFIDLDTGESMETVSVLNDQRVYGTDVMARINCARGGKSKEIYNAINNQIDKILRWFIEKYQLTKIDKCTVSGNTAMLHFFSNTDPSAMGEAPYTPAFLDERQIKGSELSLPAEDITLLPGVSAFIGADIVAGLGFLDVLNKKENAMLVDIGTNGEMAVWNGKRLLCTSTAAGSCFEGESITYGSDLINAIAAMKILGVVNESGTIVKEFADNGFFASAQGIIVTQEVVRNFQLAKSAIYSGISVLCRTAKIEPAELNAVYIAGGMGFNINLENAVKLGLLPEFSRCEICGNTSLKGAVQSLTDPDFLRKCRDIIKLSDTIDLAVDKEFADLFIENMSL